LRAKRGNPWIAACLAMTAGMVYPCSPSKNLAVINHITLALVWRDTLAIDLPSFLT
jgi:hypothetical protein